MRLTATMLYWLVSVHRGTVRRLTSIPAHTRRALESRHLVARDPDTLEPVLTPGGRLVVEGVLAERQRGRFDGVDSWE